MNLLAIDTSTENASVALAVDGKLNCKEHLGAQSHTQFILPAIDFLLTEMGVAFAELDGIVFGQGPGSFTGLRVACSLAKGLAYAHNLPLYPVSTLAALREAWYFEKSKLDVDVQGVLTIIDARMNQVYWSYATLAQHGSGVEAVSFAKDVVVPGNAPFSLVGVGFEKYEHEFSSDISQRIVERVVIYPEAALMMRLVEQDRVAPVQAGDAMPVYIRDQVTS
ncbi:MAG: tRNA (adenosine(37)-N6)-threonylcarbamoyltransferase complex dimerization subunit type 1 TsaB [Legionellales bacterium RIFCSPHIGHO2_12_FULL_42_9]|nr:MAG: tRNA (adenosine(37)-N6)-threonylcarbamoyltransferase complex dimerization subunit type 1 TsaB [Legionellales bacterium RIFCSPHIGHO2_12_FULL_42_9]